MPYRTITFERHGPLASLVLQRPEQGNAISRRMVREIADVCEVVEDDPAVFALVVSGAGSVFSIGWDPTDFALESGADELPEPGAFEPVARLSKPVVAALVGDTLSGGLELALTADVRVAARDARFGFPETNWEIIPVAGGVQRLVRLVGRAAALEMLMTGEPVDSAAALSIGLVSHVVPAEEVLAVATSIAGRIASRGPLAVRFAKEAVRQGIEMPLDQALRYETDLTVILQTTEDRSEGVRAFVEKRQPRFSGS